MTTLSRTLHRNSLARSLVGARMHSQRQQLAVAAGECNGGPAGPTMPLRLRRTNLTIAASSRAYHSSAPALKKKDELRPKSTEGLQPKILNESPPVEDQQSDEVRKHNEEMSKRADRASMKVSNADAKKDKASQQPREDDKEHDQTGKSGGG